MLSLGHAIILYGPIGAGKTTTAWAMSRWAKKNHLRVKGILGLRVPTSGSYPCYDVVDLEKERSLPLVKPRELAERSDWDSFGNPVYSFSIPGFMEANRILINASEGLTDDSVVFLDEYGRLESQGRGIFEGVMSVVKALEGSGTGVFLCRDDKVVEVTSLLEGKTHMIYRMKPGNLLDSIEVLRACVNL